MAVREIRKQGSPVLGSSFAGTTHLSASSQGGLTVKALNI